MAQSQLTHSQFEFLRDIVIVAARRMSGEQILEIADDLHTVLRRRASTTWESRRHELSGFAIRLGGE